MRTNYSFAFTLVYILLCSLAVAQETGEKNTDKPAALETVSPSITPPKLLEYVEAEYPAEAKKKGIEAIVPARLDIDENGLVVGVQILERAGHGFDEAAEAALYQFLFLPAQKDGVPVVAQVTYKYAFVFQEEESALEKLTPLNAKIEGKIADMNDAPIKNASLVITPLFASAGRWEPQVTDEKGEFVFKDLLAGAYQVDIVAAGMRPFSVIEELQEGELRGVIYRLETEEILYETIVRGKRPPREVTRREVTRREIVRIPGTGGDALRSIQNLPGMARAPFISGALIVRGSSPQDSKYFFDQAPIPLLYHFGGLTSVINSDLLESIDFFPGNYGLRYGGATGGIVDVYPKVPATDRLHAYVDADFWDIGALVETPLSKCWSIAVSARRSYIDAIMNAVLPESDGLKFTVAPRYYDYQLVANYHPKTSDELQLFFFGSDDKLVMLFGNDVADNPNFIGGAAFSIFFHQGQARWTHHFSKDISNKLNLGIGYQSNKSSFAGMFKFDNKAVPFFLRDEFIVDFSKYLTLRTGIDSEFWWGQWEVYAPNTLPSEGEEFDPITNDQQIEKTKGETTFGRAGWYGELELRPIEDLRFIGGVRLDYFDMVHKVGFDPRLVARYTIFNGTVLKGGVGLFHQMPQDFELDKHFGNPNLNLIRAAHYSVGVEQKITSNIEAGIEGFYKDMSGLVVSTQDTVEQGGEEVPLRYNNDGKGSVYGLEFLLKHQPVERFFGWISYTLMKSARRDHPGEPERLFDFDQTHILTVVASAVLGRGWEAGIRFRLVTGNPDTPIIDSYLDSDSNIYIPIYGKANSVRLPTFHQLDVRIDKKWKWKYLSLAIYIDVQNVYNQKNPEGYQYNYDYSQKRYFTGLPVLPSLGLKIEY